MPTEREVIFLASYTKLNVLRLEAQSCWMVFDDLTAELRGRIPDSMTLLEAAAKLAEIAGEMGALYALRDEAKVASPGGKA